MSSNSLHSTERVFSPVPAYAPSTSSSTTSTSDSSIFSSATSASYSTAASSVSHAGPTPTLLNKVSAIHPSIRIDHWFLTIHRKTGMETGIGNGNRNNTCAYHARTQGWCTCARAKRWVYNELLEEVHERMEAAWQSGGCLDEARGFDATAFEQDDEVEVWDGVVRGERQDEVEVNMNRSE